ncbi:MAG TPA: type II toxin-antitoxin system HicB family antitoxin [Candidatus Binatia bacterium]|nr:type II toxin-antitoxin system HicB family antitoxin [Candidatus Binatia bacterium]
MQYLIVIEKTETGYSAYSPDLDGCVATGSTKPEVEKNMREAIAFHIEGLRHEGYIVPQPNSYSTLIDVPI